MLRPLYAREKYRMHLKLNGAKNVSVHSSFFLILDHYYRLDNGVGICWNNGVWDDEVEDDVGDPRALLGNGFARWGRVAATNPKSSFSPLTEEPRCKVSFASL